ncbi:MAG: 4-alpha-glucanotransferase [Lachnospiraceae bacterium]|nr:4-alpha-glucanotransferase [Lachnospiraceae bacterium]
MKRTCGVLLPVASLPSRYGIGCFSTEAYRFVDFLADSGQTWWQILPLGQTGYGDSPYQSFSTFAGNPYFIDLEQLIGAGYISREEADQYDFGNNPSYVDYDRIYQVRYLLLHHAYENSPFALRSNENWSDASYNRDRYAFETYITNNKEWLEDYALYSALKGRFENAAWMDWDEDIRLRRPEAMKHWRRVLQNEIRFYCFMQYMFYRQWKAVKDYADKKGIRILGDLPIYVALDSADTWSHPELFKLDDTGSPTVVAGCPPDAFSATGQLWGNPIYDWDKHREEEYAWWKSRMEHAFFLYDAVRIDHFRGFDEYWAVPYGSETAMTGKWCKGPGYDLFAAMEEKLGRREIVAEDLGYLTKTVLKLVERTGYPGMKVLQFAFDGNTKNAYLPHNYTKNAVVYTGTHDNDTTRGWYTSANRKQMQFIRKYVNIRSSRTATYDLIRLAMQSVADTAIIPIQDYLDIGSDGRINIPSTLGGNWSWRVLPGELTPELAEKMREFASVYGRIAE